MRSGTGLQLVCDSGDEKQTHGGKEPVLLACAFFMLRSPAPGRGQRSLAVGASPRKTMAKHPQSRVAATERHRRLLRRRLRGFWGLRGALTVGWAAAQPGAHG